MHDVSFIIPLRIDTGERIQNLDAVLRFIGKYFPASERIVVESDTETRIQRLRDEQPGVHFLLTEARGRFSKSNTFNEGIRNATRRFVCLHDADVLLDPRAFRAAVRLLRTGVVRTVLPFNWVFADVRGELAREIRESLEVGRSGRLRCQEEAAGVEGLGARVIKGGTLLADRRVMLLEGGFNRKMISYGWEDSEIIRRLDKLGYRTFSLRRYSVVHLDHARGPDSTGNEHYELNEMEFRKVDGMTKHELQRYVETDLDIAGIDAGAARIALRRRQRLINTMTLAPILQALNQAVVAAQVYGVRRVLARGLTRGA